MNSSPVYYSCCSGYNFYFSDDRRPCEVFKKTKKIIQHVKTEEYFYVTPFPDELCNDFNLDYWVGLIRKPAALKNYIWPVDIVVIPDGNDENREKYALVFPIRALPVFEPMANLLSNDVRKDIQAGWDKPWVKMFINNILTAWSRFDSSDYAYHEFSADNMFYHKESYNVMFDFSFSTQKTDELFSPLYVSKDRIMPDYADSYYYDSGRDSLMDMASDYYSMAVILFKLIIGRLPYQGNVMAHVPDSGELEHAHWLVTYHQNTYFIFDERDSTNHIGAFASDDLYIERWNSLPLHVRNMFHNVFQAANVLRKTNNLIYYSPDQWFEALFGEEPAEVELSYREVSSVPETAKSFAKNKPDIPDIIDDTAVKFNISDTMNFEIKSDDNDLRNDTDDTGGDIDFDAGVDDVADDAEEIYGDTGEKINLTGKLADSILARLNFENEELKNKKYRDVIVLKSPQADKLPAIKTIREITGVGLAAAKKLYEDAPFTAAKGISEELANKICAELKLVNLETELIGNSGQDEQTEQNITDRMKDRWQSKTDK